MATPCALFSSCSDNFNPSEFIKLILCTDDLSHAKHVTECIASYNWHIDTKYYTADIDLCTSTKRTIGNQEFADSVQAFVVYFDPKQESTFDKVKAWIPFIEQIEPEILILVCDNCSNSDAVSRLSAQQWCIDNGFELVELNPIEEDYDDDVEDDFVETTGVKRIIQALHAHMWSCLRMKQDPVLGSPYYQQLVKEEVELKAQEVHPESTTSALEPVCISTNTPSSIQVTSNETKIAESALDDLLPAGDELALLAGLGKDDADEESFEELFAKFKVMKDKADSLAPDERKVYAEKIAVSFWKAIGGDDEEIDGLDSDTEIQSP